MNTTNDIVYFLKQEYVRRVQRNPKYSLRGFADFLRVDQSLLSKILAGKRKPTAQFLNKVAKQLPLAMHESGSLTTVGSSNGNAISNLDTQNRDYRQMSEENFRILSEWYHFALLELIKSTHQKGTPKKWAKLLGVSEIEVSLALERLRKLKYIEPHRGHWLIQSASNTWLNEYESSTARRLLQRKLLEKAVQALDEVPFEERDHSSLTVACDPDLLPEIRKRIKEFRRSLDAYIEKNGSAKQVYNLSIAFYPLTNKEKS